MCNTQAQTTWRDHNATKNNKIVKIMLCGCSDECSGGWCADERGDGVKHEDGTWGKDKDECHPSMKKSNSFIPSRAPNLSIGDLEAM